MHDDSEHSISFNYQIKNDGPSNIEKARIDVMIPQLYTLPLKSKVVLVDQSDINIKCNYMGDIREALADPKITDAKKVALKKDNSLGVIWNFVKTFNNKEKGTFMNCSDPKNCINRYVEVDGFQSGVEVIDVEITVRLNFQGISMK